MKIIDTQVKFGERVPVKKLTFLKTSCPKDRKNFYIITISQLVQESGEEVSSGNEVMRK